MKKFPAVSLFIFLMSAFVFGQGTGQGYLFVAPGSSWRTTTVHFGGGGEADLYKGLGLGIDLGYMAPTKYYGSGIGIFSPNGRFAFRISDDSKLVPYVTAGYSLLFRTHTANAYNYGGGIDYWFAEKYGLKVEFRDHVLTNCIRNCHAYQVRMGVSFR
jgi:hypothetical protein